MEQHKEDTGTRKDLVFYRLQTAKADLNFNGVSKYYPRMSDFVRMIFCEPSTSKARGQFRNSDILFVPH